MQLDIRIPIGCLFSLIGALLILQGLLGAGSLQGAFLGLNIDVAWGLVMAAFGAAMLFLRW